MRRIVLTTLLCASAAIAGYLVRPEPVAQESPAPATARRAPVTLTEILAGRTVASHADRWEATLDLLENPPPPEQ